MTLTYWQGDARQLAVKSATLLLYTQQDLVLSALPGSAAVRSEEISLPIVPLPAELTRRPGRFTLDANTRIGASGDARAPAWLLHDLLRAGTGLALPVTPTDDPQATVRLRIVPDGTAGTEGSGGTGRTEQPESYSLDITEDGIDLTAPAPAGLSRAVQTLRQLLPPDALRNSPVLSEPAAVPCVTIRDTPRYGWRGTHLDVARHWMPKEFLLRWIDLAALHRLNVVHLHLTDDQGWRVEVPGWPRLTEVGGWRAQTLVGHGREPRGYDGTPHGGYYTARDLREVVAYAAQRHITVVPEIDLPGHVQAALAAYPELGCTGRQLDVATGWGVSEHVLAPTDEAIGFARDVLDTVCDIFPSPFVHLGGDECPRTEWRASTAARERARELGLDSVDGLQSWFLRTLATHLGGRGRRVAGWDEMLEDGGMPTETVIMAWQAATYGTAALTAGHDVVMCPQERIYFDHYQSAGADEPLALGGSSTLEDVAALDPAPPEAPVGEEAGRLLGVQGQLWTEYTPTPRDVEYMAFPRLAALAEVGWTPAERRDPGDLIERLGHHQHRLDALGAAYRPLDGPHPWQRGGTGARRRHYPKG